MRFTRPGAEYRHRLHQTLGLTAKAVGGGGHLFDQGGVLLRHLIQRGHGLADLGHAVGLLLAGGADLADQGVQALHAGHHVGHGAAGGLGLLVAGAHARVAGLDQAANLLGGLAAAPGQVAHLAGHHGKAAAAKEIKQLITDSVQRVEQGTQLADRAGTTMGEVVGAIGRVTDIMGEISAASREQADGVAQVSEAVSHMDKSTQQNAALVEQSAAAADSLKTQAGQLVDAVAVFRLSDNATRHNSSAPAPVRSSAPAASRLDHRNVSPRQLTA